MTTPSIKEALEYERRIRTKIYASNILTAGEWVYLVGVFQAANEHEECPALATLSQPTADRREIVATHVRSALLEYQANGSFTGRMRERDDIASRASSAILAALDGGR